MSRSRDDASDAAGDQPTDTGRAERVAQADGVIQTVYRIAGRADHAAYEQALEGCAELKKRIADFEKAVRREAEEAGEGQRRREAVHGKNTRDA